MVLRLDSRIVDALKYIGLAVLAVITVALSAVALTQQPQSALAGQAPGAAGSVEQVDDRPAAVFIGDSYTASAGASTVEAGYAHLVAAQMGWNAQYFADIASGYSVAGEKGLTMSTLLDAADGTPADHVVIATGYNDPLTDELPATIRATLERVRAMWPEADITVLGPWTPSGEPKPWQVDIRNIIRDTSADLGLRFADTIDGAWFAGLVMTDGVHPDDAGHAAIAGRLVEALQP